MEPVHAKYLLEKINKVPSLMAAEIYRFQGGSWRSIADESIVAESLLSKAFNGLSPSTPISKVKSPPRAIFLLRAPDLAVVLPVGPRARDNTLNDLFKRLDECLSAATSSFHAHYDELTGVLNRHGIRHAISQAVVEVRAAAPVEAVETQLTTRGDIVLYCFDIDRFKSVNDTLGHAAGDLVLASFASRLSSLVQDLEKNYSAKFIFGRPGGEEFELIGIGSFSSHERDILGQYLLEAIRKPLIGSLPKSKKSELAETGKQAEDLLSRNSGITASIGLSWSQMPDKPKKLEGIHSKLRKESDAALYRAKADGRNCLRAYNDIRLKHGRVIETYDNSGLVQIDIGAKVGVNVGDSFSVFFPPFVGGEKILESEKSLKVLGEYPTIESARIRVIDVQNDVSTCDILPSSTSKTIPPGSRLKYLHTGFKHIALTRLSNQSALTTCLSKIDEYIHSLIREKNLGAVCLINPPKGWFENNREHRANELALISSLFFPKASQIFQGIKNDFYVVIPKLQEDSEETLFDQLSAVSDKLNAVEDGFYVNACIFDDLELGVSKSSEALLFYCNAMQHEPALDSAPHLKYFDSYTGGHDLSGWRKKEDFWNGLADYQQFRNFGFETASLHNQMALFILESEMSLYYSFAVEILQKAIVLEPDEPAFSANLGVAFARQENFLAAYESFVSVEKFFPEGSKSAYLLTYAKAALEVFKSGGNIEKSKVHSLISSALASSNGRRQGYSMRIEQELRQAIATEDVKVDA